MKYLIQASIIIEAPPLDKTFYLMAKHHPIDGWPTTKERTYPDNREI